MIVLLVGRLILSGVCADDAGESAAKAVVGSATIDAEGFMLICDCIEVTSSVVIFVRVCSAFGGGLTLCECMLFRRDFLRSRYHDSQSQQPPSDLSSLPE